MTDKSKSYLELLSEKELHRATNKLTPESAARYAAHLDRIWNDLDEHEQASIDAELSAVDDRSQELRALRIRVAELEAERDRMLPIYTAHLAAEQRAVEWRERERLRVATLTEHELHREQRHPGYEYDTTENARKSGDSPRPSGEGWEANEIIECHLYKDGVVIEERWCNWTRGDYTETNYWRRRKLVKEQP